MSEENFEGQIPFLITKSNLSKDLGEEDDIIIEGLANTTSMDRAGDLIPRSTWEKPSQLTNYKKNPIVLAYHNHSMPIGVVESLEVRDEGLFVRVKISNVIPAVYQQIKKEILKAFSIGFRLIDWDYNEKIDAFVMTDIEMHELSVVSVPCNQDSVFDLAKSIGVTDRKSLLNKKSTVAPVESETMKLARQLGCLKGTK